MNYSRELLSQMKRTDLQRIAKQHGVRANIATTDLILSILEHQRGPVKTAANATHVRPQPSHPPVPRPVPAASGPSGSENTRIPHATQVVRNQAVKESQLRLGLGRPQRLGGTGARQVTKPSSVTSVRPSRSLPKGKGKTASREGASTAVNEQTPALVGPDGVAGTHVSQIASDQPPAPLQVPEQSQPPQPLMERTISSYLNLPPSPPSTHRIASTSTGLADFDQPPSNHVLSNRITSLEAFFAKLQETNIISSSNPDQPPPPRDLASELETLKLEVDALRQEVTDLRPLRTEVNELRGIVDQYRTRLQLVERSSTTPAVQRFGHISAAPPGAPSKRQPASMPSTPIGVRSPTSNKVVANVSHGPESAPASMSAYEFTFEAPHPGIGDMSVIAEESSADFVPMLTPSITTRNYGVGLGRLGATTTAQEPPPAPSKPVASSRPKASSDVNDESTSDISNSSMLGKRSRNGAGADVAPLSASSSGMAARVVDSAHVLMGDTILVGPAAKKPRLNEEMEASGSQAQPLSANLSTLPVADSVDPRPESQPTAPPVPMRIALTQYDYPRPITPPNPAAGFYKMQELLASPHPAMMTSHAYAIPYIRPPGWRDPMEDARNMRTPVARPPPPPDDEERATPMKGTMYGTEMKDDTRFGDLAFDAGWSWT